MDINGVKRTPFAIPAVIFSVLSLLPLGLISIFFGVAAAFLGLGGLIHAVVSKGTRSGVRPAVFAILVGGIIGIFVAPILYGKQASKMDDERMPHMARSQLNVVSDNLVNYMQKHGKYPTTSEGLNTLSNEKLLSSVLLKDPWGNPFVYESPGKVNASTFDLYSKGPNGSGDGTEPDDINNWSR